MMEVSASEPQAGEAQSRGVPSATSGLLGCGLRIEEMCVRERERLRTGESGHVYTVGTLDLSDDTVGRGMGCNGCNEGEGVPHLD
jgi:hypothetical protein